MTFVKKLLQYLVFSLGLAGLFVYLTLFIGSFWRAEPGWWTLFILIAGLLSGIGCARVFQNLKPKKRRWLVYFGTACFMLFMAIVGLMVGASLGGNGIVNIEFAGLVGYESAGLLFAILGSVLGTYLAYRILAEKGIPVLWTILACSLGAGLELLAGGMTWIQSGAPYLASLFLPLLFILILDWQKHRPSAR